MNNLNNRKINTLVPQWAPFPGCTVLFDNPGDNYKPIYEANGKQIVQIDCSMRSREIAFYLLTHYILNQLIPKLPKEDYLFCPLPYSSYHVTLADLGNVSQFPEMDEPVRKKIDLFFRKYPLSVLQPEDLIGSEILLDIQRFNKGEIRFQFKEIKHWQKVVAIALEAADEVSETYLKALEKRRKEWQFQFKKEFGSNIQFREDYVPHVTLGYFANTAYSTQFKSHKEQWNEAFLKGLRDENGEAMTISFNSFSLYGFWDMARFFKVSS